MGKPWCNWPPWLEGYVEIWIGYQRGKAGHGNGDSQCLNVLCEAADAAWPRDCLGG